jgi:hypothetical protein
VKKKRNKKIIYSKYTTFVGGWDSRKDKKEPHGSARFKKVVSLGNKHF